MIEDILMIRKMFKEQYGYAPRCREIHIKELTLTGGKVESFTATIKAVTYVWNDGKIEKVA